MCIVFNEAHLDKTVTVKVALKMSIKKQYELEQIVAELKRKEGNAIDTIEDLINQQCDLLIEQRFGQEAKAQ